MTAVRRTALCALAALLLVGCGDAEQGTNGVGGLAPGAIVSQARGAAERADTVRLSGSVSSGGRTYRLDVRLGPDAGSGRVSTGHDTYELLRVGTDLYLKGSRLSGGLGGKYVKVPTGDPAYRRLSGLTDKRQLLDGLFSLGSNPARGGHRSVGGTPTIAVTAPGGTLDVSLRGRPYPLRYESSGGAGSLQLTGWGEAFTVRAPDSGRVLDYGKVSGF
ncbi:hypothetical protein ACFOSC_03045 [Streptantibioticus rubrisoli]|uniref:Lipoprotein n=1 Tax=Streptantibioticus rubrisoli TaxID=1387313 RepID=A0ABT1PC38_9ACTN|nr:hypothetical protein [Streptantibioticus rubrisoli]MCQ4042938.1 hypothetical protein [Streptantibioticus rubrisoli]